MERGLLLDVVVRERAPVFELLASKDQSLLIRRDTLFVLNLRLHIVDSITSLNIECNRFSSQRLNENLHAASQTQNQMKCGLFLDVVVRQRATILELLASEDQSLLIRGDAFLVLNLSFD